MAEMGRTTMLTTSRIVTIALLVAAAAAATASLMTNGPDERADKPLTPLSFQLSWFHNGGYAGYYAADRQGHYAEEGLEIRFVQGGPKVDPVLSVLEGRAQIGVANASHLLKARSEGKPVRAIAVIHQLNPVLFVTMEGSGITHPSQFAGKTIRTTVANLPILQAVAQRFGITPEQYKVVQTPDLSEFYSGDVDVVTGFHFWTKNKMEKDGQRGIFMYPDNYGIHLYRNCIFTTDDFIAEDPDVIAGFLRATLTRGWLHAVREPEVAGPLIAKYAPKADVAHETRLLMAMLPLINTGEVPIGWMKPEIWTGMAETLERIGYLDRPVDADDVYTMRFLEDIYLGGVGG